MSVLRPLHLAAWAAWVGAFSLYFGVVAPTARQVLGHPPTVGLITQQVTWWFLGAAVILAVTGMRPAMAAFRTGSRGWHFGLGLWIITTGLQIACHPLLDRQLTSATVNVLDQEAFRPLHHLYLAAAMVQWGAGVWLVWIQMRALGQRPAFPAASVAHVQ
jgi:hypothetical protein